MTPEAIVGAGCIILGVALFAAVIAICAVIGAGRMRTPEEQAREDAEQIAALEGRR